MASKYRIDAIEIAGFKAFTNPQRVPIDGKTTFIFGENGLGKSSIMEAIVWCLYGTDPHVRNQLFQGPCFVNLYLRETSAPSSIYRIQRRMHQADNESDVDVFYPDGTRRNITDFVPQLKKMEHGPGTRVIFAEQEPGRRYSHDLNNFEELIAAYLGLDVGYSLVDWFERFLEEQEKSFDLQVRSKEKAIADEINRRVQSIHERIKMITAQPPWDGQFPPSEGNTVAKGISLLKDIFSMLGENLQTAVSAGLDPLLAACMSKLEQLESSSSKSLADAANALQSILTSANDARNRLQQIIQRVQSLEASLAESASTLGKLLGSKSESALIEERETLLSSKGLLIHRANLIQEASHLMTDDLAVCPVCNISLEPAVLKNRLASLRLDVTEDTSKVQSRIDDINSVLRNIASIRNIIQTTTLAIGLAQQDKSKVEKELSDILGIQQITIAGVDEKLLDLTRSLEDLNRKTQSENAKLSALHDRLAKLRRAAEYHKLIRYLSRLDSFLQSEDHKKAQAKIAEFDQHLHSIKMIRATLEQAYFDAFSSYLPSLSQEMTAVYRRLTKQKSFDTIRIVSEPGNPLNKSRRKMILQVGLPRRGVWVAPNQADVLNGQALSALNLVPYFAFARIGMSKHEIDFLLIDDPSQSFDTSHVEYLLDLMKSVAGNAQIIIATHEKDRVQDKLDSFFEDYNIIAVDSFGIDSGPHFSSSNHRA